MLAYSVRALQYVAVVLAAGIFMHIFALMRAHGQDRPSNCPPRAWCGCYARLALVNSDPGPNYNKAINWKHWGKAARPEPGVIVVWPHHVGKIVSLQSNGVAVVLSGNDGNMVRERPRSIRNAIAFREAK